MPARASRKASSRRRNAVHIHSAKRIRLRRGPARKVNYVISQIPHKKQRYDTVGDWIPGSPVRIRVSRMKDERYVFLVALHELIEYELCRMNGIADNEVVKFDVNFERERAEHLHSIEAEPGNDPRAPYRDEHAFATMIERMVAQKMGVSWSDYEKALLSLSHRRRVAIKPLIRNRLPPLPASLRK